MQFSEAFLTTGLISTDEELFFLEELTRKEREGLGENYYTPMDEDWLDKLLDEELPDF